MRPFQSRLAAPKARPDDGFPTATSSPISWVSDGGFPTARRWVSDDGFPTAPIVGPLTSNKTSYHKLQDPQS